MKVLLSSKSLLKALDELPDLNIMRVGLTRKEDKTYGTLNFRLLNDNIVFVDVVIIKFEKRIYLYKSFHGIRWDWVRDLMRLVAAQPITLEIKKDVINVIFQY